MREIRHTNVNNFIGAMVDQDNIKLVTEFCSKGALFDLLNNPDVKLDLMFVASLISDLVNGMHFLHNSTQLGVHGNLRHELLYIWTERLSICFLLICLHEAENLDPNYNVLDYDFR